MQLFRVSLFHSDETFICMHAQEVLFSNKIYKKACNVFLKMIIKIIVFITKCNEKNCLKYITLEKKLSASPKNGNPSIKYNGPSLKASFLSSQKPLAAS